MIPLLIALLLTLSTGGDICETGQSVDWYQWIADHPTPQKVMTYEASEPNFWVYQADGETVLFVFREPIEKTLARGEYAAHGQCSRLVTLDD